MLLNQYRGEEGPEKLALYIVRVIRVQRRVIHHYKLVDLFFCGENGVLNLQECNIIW
mgnify:CR=1